MKEAICKDFFDAKKKKMHQIKYHILCRNKIEKWKHNQLHYSFLSDKNALAN